MVDEIYNHELNLFKKKIEHEQKLIDKHTKVRDYFLSRISELNDFIDLKKDM